MAMAVGGQVPKPTHLRLIDRAGHRPIPQNEPSPEGAPSKPPKLKGRAGKIWDETIVRCFWLTWADQQKAMMWCHMAAEFEGSPAKMTASRIAQLRVLGSELGLDPGSRARLGTKSKHGNSKDPAEKYFGSK